MFRTLVPISIAAVLGFLPAMGGVAPAAAKWQPPRVGAPSACKEKIDNRGGYQRYHLWCEKKGDPLRVGGPYQLRVAVRCQNGAEHLSGRWRDGYNKAECNLKREGPIVGKIPFICGEPPCKAPRLP